MRDAPIEIDGEQRLTHVVQDDAELAVTRVQFLRALGDALFQALLCSGERDRGASLLLVVLGQIFDQRGHEAQRVHNELDRIL